MGDIPEGGEIAVKFGLDKEGEVQIEGYMEPRNKTGFLTDELRTAYLLASTESKELQRDKKRCNSFKSMHPDSIFPIIQRTQILMKYTL